MKRTQALLSVLSGLLLWAAWPVSPLTFLIFVAFVPFLLLERRISSGLHFFGRAYLTMLIWNVLTTWWICNSTVPGGIAAMLANSLLMCIPLMGFFTTRKKLGEGPGYLALVVFWLTFEYIHLNWQLSWPWLTLGNAFAMYPDWVQWYEYTGTSGGSLWILLSNVFIYRALSQTGRERLPWPRRWIPAVLITGFPLVCSLLIDREPKGSGQMADIVVVQPNIDPYAKFAAGSQEGQMQLLIRLSETQIDENTDMVIWPETALNDDTRGIELDNLRRNDFLDPVWQFLKRHPGLTLYTGIEGVRFFYGESKTRFSRPTGNPAIFYESHNAATLLDAQGPSEIYSKSKLVPGVETIPGFLHFMDAWFEQFGGTTGGYASQEVRTVLTERSGPVKVAPAICYESIYGEFLTNYIRGGANMIGIITNDGWWANTSGHKQHMQYARLRAIETRRWISRSANTGISCFISPAGTIIDPQPWDTAAAIKQRVELSDYLSFYARFGDFISRIAISLTILLVLFGLVLRFRKQKKQA